MGKLDTFRDIDTARYHVATQLGLFELVSFPLILSGLTSIVIQMHAMLYLSCHVMSCSAMASGVQGDMSWYVTDGMVDCIELQDNYLT